MHTYAIQKAATNVSIELEIIDSTDGTPETGVVWNTAGINLQYRRDGAASTAITEATLAALTTAHTDGGFLHIGNGVYRFDVPDAAFATGVDKVVIHGTVTGMIVIPCVVQLVAYDPFDAVRLGLTALPNAAADAAGGLPISDAGGLDLDAKIGALTFTVANEVDSNVITKTGFSLAATGLDAITSTATGMVEIAKAIWDRVLTGATHNISNSAGKRLRQIDAAFEVHSGTAQAGSTTSITLDTGASATDNIYNGDRVIIIGGTGAQEHDIITAYNGTTKVATVAETWVITPDATSEFILVPASVDIETWQHSVVTGDGDWAALKAETALIVADTNELQTDDIPTLISNLDAVVDTVKVDTAAILVDTGTTLPATLAAQDAIITEARLAELDAANLPANVDNLLLGIIFGAAATGTLSTTQATSDLTGYTADQLIGRIITVTSGVAEGESSDITDYVEAAGLMTFTTMTLAMGNGDTFKIT